MTTIFTLHFDDTSTREFEAGDVLTIEDGSKFVAVKLCDDTDIIVSATGVASARSFANALLASCDKLEVKP